jgi:hypothetical protein
MRFKKWRNRPGCEGAFSLFLLNNRVRGAGGRVRGAGGRVQGAGCRVRFLSDLSDGCLARAYLIEGGLPPGWVGLDDF